MRVHCRTHPHNNNLNKFKSYIIPNVVPSHNIYLMFPTLNNRNTRTVCAYRVIYFTSENINNICKAFF